MSSTATPLSRPLKMALAAVPALEELAQETDTASTPPRRGISILADAGLLGLSVPVEFGGLGADAATVRHCLEVIASGCGTTAFVYFQHLVACQRIAGSDNAELTARLLPALAGGRRYCTLATSHLRRPGPPTLRVTEHGDDGFVFDGVAPWATGFGVATDVLLAGTDQDGSSVWVVVPLKVSDGMTISPPMRLCAANASATVSIGCNALAVERRRLVTRLTREDLAGDTARAILFFSALSLGVARAAAQLVARRASGPRADVLTQVASAIERELATARGDVDACALLTDPAAYEARALSVRAHCIQLGVRAAHAAVTVSGGSANLLDSPAQRLFREAMLYTLTAQTWDLQQATLRRVGLLEKI